MPANNRAQLIEKLHKALKKHYKVAPSQPSRPLLEHVLYASLLEDCPSELADEGMAKCEQDFFDWNEVRVTTTSELAQVLSRLPDPNRAAARLKGNLQSIFEEFYTFDLDHLKKENLGKAVKKFSDMPTMTSFVLGYTIQNGLGGHSIPLDYSAMVIMLVTGIATPAEASAGKVPGLERAIAKNKGIEFSGLLHQCAVALHEDPKNKTGRQVIDSIVKGASKELDDWLVSKKEARKRAKARKAEEKEAARLKAKADAQAAREAAAAAAAKKAAASSRRAAAKKAAGPTAAEQAALEQAAAEKKAAAAAKAKAKSKPKATVAKKAPAKTAAAKKSAPAKSKAKPAASKPASKKKSATKPADKKSKSKKSSSAAKPKAAPKKAPAAKKSASKKAASKKTSNAAGKKARPSSKKSTARKLSKRKPR